MPTPQRAIEPEAADSPLNPPPVSPTRFSLTSTAFRNGGTIPIEHTADGKDISPPLTISDLPEAIKELALICEDPDAPTSKPWVHWLLYKIPADTKVLSAAIPHSGQLTLPPGAMQGVNSFEGQVLGYRGPAPPRGRPHHYHFRLYGLDAPLDLKPGLDKQGLLNAMQGHIEAETELIGIYHR
jgi:Raf kinase inhibitor-like YbhB/YbcL family protein